MKAFSLSLLSLMLIAPLASVEAGSRHEKRFHDRSQQVTLRVHGYHDRVNFKRLLARQAGLDGDRYRLLGMTLHHHRPNRHRRHHEGHYWGERRRPRNTYIDLRRSSDGSAWRVNMGRWHNVRSVTLHLSPLRRHHDRRPIRQAPRRYERRYHDRW